MNQRYPNGNCKHAVDIYDNSGKFLGTYCKWENLDRKCPVWSRNDAFRELCLKTGRFANTEW